VLHCDLEKATFISVLTDASNQRDQDSSRACQHFDYESGMKIKISELKSLRGDTSVVVSDYLSNCLTENGLVGKIAGLVQVT
jgi:hypothetical protein